MNKIELLAPAGNFECLVAAIQSGADAVYLSGKGFGARSYADNFDNAELEKATDYCHLRGARIYVTVNTLVSNDEIPELSEYLLYLNQIGVDGIIVQDMGVVNIARSLVPQLPVHGSTQMTVFNSDGVKALEKLGIKRVVLAREVSIENIKQICQHTDAEIEVFAHGALCMCYSGQCLMSSIIGGRSGNRGKCAQPCRLPYGINDKKKRGFYLSLKDLSSLNHIDELKAIGVKSLKIEGRMKGPAYVSAVVGVYRKYLDNPQKIDKSDIDLLERIFNRGGLTDGYLIGKIGKEMFAIDKPENPYRLGSNDLEKSLLDKIRGENKKIKIEGSVEFLKNKCPRILVKYNDLEVEYVSDERIQSAQKAFATEESVKNSILKTGNTVFEFSKLNITLDDGVFVPVSLINAMRRTALECLEEKIIKSFKRTNSKTQLKKIAECEKPSSGFVCEITQKSQFDTVKNYDFHQLWIPFHLILEERKKIDGLKEKIVIVPPVILHENERDTINSEIEYLLNDGYGGVVVFDISQAERFSKYRCYGGFRLNLFNDYALDFYKNFGLSALELSPELKFKQIENIKKCVPVQTMVYGRLPLMITENCMIKNGDNCPCSGENAIIDRMGMRFPVIKDGNSCRSVILNCKKTFAGFDIERLKRSGVDFFRIYFTDESPEECKKVCESFLFNTSYRPEDFTNGHYLKGVE